MSAEERSCDKMYGQYRPLLLSIAYRMLGSVVDAEAEVSHIVCGSIVG